MLLQTNSCRTFLAEGLASRSRLNPRYSQRAFARQLGLSAGELSEILRGKRGLSLKSALRIARSLGLSGDETKHLIYLAQMEKARSRSPEDAAPILPDEEPSPAYSQRQMSLDLFQLVADWRCLAVLALADCEDFQLDAPWIARRLSTSVADVRIALERMERVGWITLKGSSKQIVQDYVISPEGIPSEAIRKYHEQVLEMAAFALRSQPPQLREFSGAGFATNPRHLPAIRKEIAAFQDHLVAKYSRGRKTDVYHVEIAVFPLSGRQEK